MKPIVLVMLAISALLSGCAVYPAPYYDRGQGQGQRDRDHDRDGVSDRRDRDRDGDGVRNNQDRRPDDPRRY